jgi:hypothetical protein
MNYQKHVHVEERWIARLDSHGGADYVQLSAYVCDAVFGLEWLPDKPIFETNLVLLLVKTGDLNPAYYHSGLGYYSAQTLSHIAALAAACYAERLTPTQAGTYIEKFKQDYKELSAYAEQGYYRGGELVWKGKLLRDKNLFTRGQFRDWLNRHNWSLPGL